eukprot:14335446-Alexandrium_andersonii.AAC.1
MLMTGNGMEEDGSAEGAFAYGNINNLRKMVDDESEAEEEGQADEDSSRKGKDKADKDKDDAQM